MLLFFYYIVKVIVCSGIMYGYYLLALRNKRFHQYNRFYLLFVVASSFIIPLITIQFWKEPAHTATMKMVTIVNEVDVYVAANTPVFNWNSFALASFTLISLGFLASLLVSLIKIFTLIKKYHQETYNNVCFVFSNTPGTPFSFFKYIFWNKEVDIESDAGKLILKHELAHVQQKHTADKLFLNVVLIVGWINPFLWLIRREINIIHEFIADQKAIHDGDANSFALMLLKSVYSKQAFRFVNSFFHSPIKRRLSMITNTHHTRFLYLRRSIIFPLLVLVVATFAFKVKDGESKQPFNQSQSNILDTAQNDEPAQFPGGLPAWRRYLERNLDLNVLAEHKAPIGKYPSIIVFTVNKDGSITNITAETKAGYGTEDEAIRLLSKGPKWQPAKKDGAFVESKVRQTINFMQTNEYGALVTIDSIRLIKD